MKNNKSSKSNKVSIMVAESRKKWLDDSKNGSKKIKGIKSN